MKKKKKVGQNLFCLGYVRFFFFSFRKRYDIPSQIFKLEQEHMEKKQEHMEKKKKTEKQKEIEIKRE